MSKKTIVALLLSILLTVTSCQKQEPQAYFQPIFDSLAGHGYAYSLKPLEGQNTNVPIYDETVWYSLGLGTEELLVYFDSSNRARHLAEQFCQDEANGKVVNFGLRFIICYAGDDEGILQMMDEWEKQYPA